MEQKDQINLQNILKMTEENNKMLKRMERRHIWSVVTRFIYIGLVVALAYQGYVYLQPYLDKATQMYNTASSELQKVQNVTNTVTDTVNKITPIKK